MSEPTPEAAPPGGVFISHNSKDEPLTCKFCHRPIWFHQVNGRCYEPGGQTYHSLSCPRRQQHYRGLGMNSQESRRQKRS